MKPTVNIWKQDVNWTDSYWCKVINEEEYKMASKYLFGERKSKQVFIGDVFESDECLFDGDVETWHHHFETKEIWNDDIEILTHPYEYVGDFKLKPNQDEYPLVLNASISMDELQLKWFSI